MWRTQDVTEAVRFTNDTAPEIQTFWRTNIERVGRCQLFSQDFLGVNRTKN